MNTAQRMPGFPVVIDRVRERREGPRSARVASVLEQRGRGLTLQQVATVLGVTSRERARQIEADALAHLRYWMQGLASGELTMDDLRLAQEQQRKRPGTRTWGVVRREAAEKAAGSRKERAA